MSRLMRMRYKRFRAWQESPFHYAMNGDESHRCCNCGHEYTGNFCPQCGQKATVGAVNWSSVRENVMEIWGVGTRSMTYTLWQLLLRPGYLIRDYISGRRQVSFPPVKMLLIVAVICSIVVSLLGAEPEDNEQDGSLGTIIAFVNWYRHNLGWGTLAVYSWMMLPTWVLFHFSPRCTAHALPQGFFIQVFLCSLAIIFATLSDLYPPIVMLIPIYYFITYYQLFGYGLWGTLWRTSLCAIVAMFILVMFFIGALDLSKETVKHPEHMKEIALPLLGFTNIVLLAIGYAISRSTHRRRMKSNK